VKTFNKLPPEIRQQIFLEVGGGPAASLAHQSYGTTAGMQHLADIQNAIADKYPRMVSWMHEAHQRGFKSPAEIEALFDPRGKLDRTLTEIGESSQQAMVKFRRVPTKLRKAVGHAIFIAPWIEGSTRWLGRFALDRPVTARVALEIRDRIMQRQQDRLGKLGQMGAGGFVPFSLPGMRGGPGLVPGVNPSGLSPTATPSEVGKAAREFLPTQLGGGGHPVGGGTRLAGFANPGVAAGLAAFYTRRDPYSGFAYPKDTGALGILQDQLVGDVSRPAIPLGATIATAFRGKPSEQGKGVYQQEHGIVDALKRLALGSARPRTVVVKNAQAKGKKIQESQRTTSQNIEAHWKDNLKTLQDAGVVQSWTPDMKLAIRAKALRKENRKGASTQQQKLKADLKTAIQLKILTREQADQLQKIFGKNADSSIETTLSGWSSAYFKQDQLNSWETTAKAIRGEK
jgi:hypothetical protein